MLGVDVGKNNGNIVGGGFLDLEGHQSPQWLLRKYVLFFFIGAGINILVWFLINIL